MVIDFSKNENHDIAGIADVLAVRRGRYIWIEFKRPGNKQQANQVEFEQKIKSHGGEYVVIESLDEMLDYLGEIEQGALI